MGNKKIPKRIFLILLLPLAILISYIGSKFPYAIEKLYSNSIYKLINQSLSRFTGVFPFSVGELLLISIVIASIAAIIVIIIRIIKLKNKRIHLCLNFLLNTIILISIAYFTFIVIWGLNYHRLPFSKISRLDARPSSTDELVMVCNDLIDRANKLRVDIEEDSFGVMNLNYSKKKVFTKATEGYNVASNLYSELGGIYGRPKGIILSKGLSISGISGIYSPFTSEANVNIEIPDCMIPSTTCHEMAHQRGFAREDEANFIAYLTCTMHPDIEFQYSGTLLALIHSMNTLYKYDRDEFTKLRKRYGDGVNRDLISLSEFWKSYEGPVERASEKLNNAYLKSNYQKDGVRSYGRMVDLLIAEYRSKESKDD
ncbi:DUF3810 domain-containing protein [Wukongibacter baidiensis]|uniref:DUF3810 domain-containing protein n=1 Tax=Wukongibacter baidiensis TaxID=1723361 RepID=UPI003D7F2CEA